MCSDAGCSPATPPGRTYRYLAGTPLYSFGFGLTYGSIRYANAEVAPPTHAIPAGCAAASGRGGYNGASGGACGRVTVCVEVTNANTTRSAATEEVVQVWCSCRRPAAHCD